MFGKESVDIRQENLSLRCGEEDLSIIQISDTHIPFCNRRLDAIAMRIEEVNPELILLTGDYVDTASSLEKFKDLIRQISRQRTLCYILGNHNDRFRSEIKSIMKSHKQCFCVDDDPHVFISKSGFKYLISSWQTRNRFVEDRDLRQIVLVHNPRSIKFDQLKYVDVVFAGHLHGGQFVLKKLNNGSLFPGCMFYRCCFESRIVNGTKIIVSKGLGDVFPFRINCPHELVFLRIS